MPEYILHPLIRSALAEDIGAGDVTTAAVLTGAEAGMARAVAKADMVLAGIDVFRMAFLLLDPDVRFTGYVEDGREIKRGEIIAELSGRLASILTAERTALNFLQRMSGIATTTRRYVQAVAGTRARILDTRKTAPGLRVLDKYAVRMGGGGNHRFALYDGVLIKDNHITAAGGVAPAIQRARRNISHTLKIEVEVKNIDEVREALSSGVDAVMLDNMTPDAMSEAVRLIGGRVPVEASGNVTPANVRQIAETGVDFISVGALTHSVTAADISLLVGVRT
ncbi:MAG: nicotinate-nucleotide diphosphorylase (carboxylating) [Syntrophus sp. (in: bacteria)]|nr:nicotinate-nucleotide diphosphorylase (carboxylating) [Syntrophus sp. (in: bacteria)]